MQASKPIGLLIANRRIAATLAIAGIEHVPDTKTMREHALQSFRIRHLDQRLAEQGCQQGPELIARMRVILARGERRLRWKAAKDQAFDVAVDDRWEAA